MSKASTLEEKKEKILDLAAAALTQHGAIGFRFSDLAKQAGCSNTTLYKIFSSKEDLLVELFTLNMKHANTLVEQALELQEVSLRSRLLLAYLIEPCWSVTNQNTTIWINFIANHNSLVHQANGDKIQTLRATLRRNSSLLNAAWQQAVTSGELISDIESAFNVQKRIVMAQRGAISLMNNYFMQEEESFNLSGLHDNIANQMAQLSWSPDVVETPVELLLERHFTELHQTLFCDESVG
ncbi:TetR/AcrR family transcriptional regulator [Ferrimonas pelagia]|uniref:HTH tetR-type domain-containing protein n=1 Tax=Ferrimonas pelagia TaxID=1177826 RepID=A0ABP9EKP6_9GAMM